MNRELSQTDNYEYKSNPNPPWVDKIWNAKPVTINLAIISTPAFIHNLKDLIYKFFTTSLYKINRILEDQNLESSAEEEIKE
jgi:hypothetical protein